MNTKVFYLVVGMLFFAGLAVAMFFALNTSTIKPGGQDIALPDESTESYECQADAMICPDGSTVGQQGPKCEFAACPEVTATSTLVTAYLGGSVTGLNVNVTSAGHRASETTACGETFTFSPVTVPPRYAVTSVEVAVTSGQAANSHFGPCRPTVEPSGQIMASAWHSYDSVDSSGRAIS